MSRTVLPFGKYKDKSISQLPDNYLRWLARQTNGDLDYWAQLAKKQLNERKHSDDLEQIADDFLRSHGFDPDSL